MKILTAIIIILNFLNASQIYTEGAGFAEEYEPGYEGNITYTDYGNVVYGSDGSQYIRYGNTTYGSNGTVYRDYSRDFENNHGGEW
jgi:hypothetical protein